MTSVSLKALDGLVADGAMPFPSLSSLLQVACRRANTAKHTKFCFDMVESVLNISTYIGLLGVHTLCEILCNNELCTASPDLARGAVYMLTHSAWGNMKVGHFCTLCHQPSSTNVHPPPPQLLLLPK